MPFDPKHGVQGGRKAAFGKITDGRMIPRLGWMCTRGRERSAAARPPQLIDQASGHRYVGRQRRGNLAEPLRLELLENLPKASGFTSILSARSSFFGCAAPWPDATVSRAESQGGRHVSLAGFLAVALTASYSPIQGRATADATTARIRPPAGAARQVSFGRPVRRTRTRHQPCCRAAPLLLVQCGGNGLHGVTEKDPSCGIALVGVAMSRWGNRCTVPSVAALAAGARGNREGPRVGRRRIAAATVDGRGDAVHRLREGRSSHRIVNYERRWSRSMAAIE